MKSSRASRVTSLPWHPFLLAAFPVLTLAAHNADEIHLFDPLRTLLIALLLAALLLLLFRWALKDWKKAGMAATLVIVLIFTYGHVYQFLESQGLGFGRHRLLAPLYLAIFAVVLWRLVRTKTDLLVSTQALNLLAVTALIFPLAQLCLFTVRQARAQTTASELQQSNLQETQGHLPDIYYIILDAYSRDDVLRDFYRYDNSQFLSELEGLGFYVARCSRSNYASTTLSLPSSLNMDFVDNLMKYEPEDPFDRQRAAQLIKVSQVRRELEALGYKTVGFETGYPWTQIEGADLYISTRSNELGDLFVTGGLNRFEELLLRTTAGLALVDGAKILPDFIRPSLEYPNESYRRVVLNILDRLGGVSAMPGPKFVFAHIGSPHEPFVFGPDGEKVPAERQDSFAVEAYRDQVIYLNSRMIPILREIISASATPPVIILQADHGGMETEAHDRMAILNAYYLPDGGNDRLYENISPVNSFRLVFNTYLNGDYELLEDTSYFSKNLFPYKFTVVEETRPECIDE